MSTGITQNIFTYSKGGFRILKAGGGGPALRPILKSLHRGPKGMGQGFPRRGGEGFEILDLF